MAQHEYKCQSCFHRDVCPEYHPQTYSCVHHLDEADVAPRAGWISVVEDPPDEETWVMGYKGHGNYEIVKIEKGIDEETRDKMRTGEIYDPETKGWTAADGIFVIKRSKVFKAADVFGNNKVPYCWRTTSGHTIFGQNITWWMPLPEPPKGV